MLRPPAVHGPGHAGHPGGHGMNTVVLRFVAGADRRQLWSMGGLTVVAGLANAALVVMINDVAKMVAAGERPGLLVWGLFAGAFLLYYLSNMGALLRANVVIEQLLNRLRLDVVDKLRQSELLVADQVGRGSLYSMVAQETNHLSVTFPLLVDGLQQALLLVFAVL